MPPEPPPVVSLDPPVELAPPPPVPVAAVLWVLAVPPPLPLLLAALVLTVVAELLAVEFAVAALCVTPALVFVVVPALVDALFEVTLVLFAVFGPEVVEASLPLHADRTAVHVR